MKTFILWGAMALTLIPALAHAQSWRKANPNTLYEREDFGTPGYVAPSDQQGNLQPPTTSTRGGVKAATGSNQVITGIDTTGTPTTAPFIGTTTGTAYDGGLGAATAATAAAAIPTATIGAANGVAPLDGSSHVPPANLPPATSSVQGAMSLTTAGEQAPVQSVAGLTGAPSAAQTRAALATTTTLTAGPSYTALTTDTYICVAETSPVATTITLPASPLTNQVIDVNDCGGHASTANITIAASSIMGTTSVVMNQPYEDLTLKYTSGGWAIW